MDVFLAVALGHESALYVAARTQLQVALQLADVVPAEERGRVPQDLGDVLCDLCDLIYVDVFLRR